MAPRTEDWLSRLNYADIYPRKEDPFRPSAGNVSFSSPAASMFTPEELTTNPDIYRDYVSIPGSRPFVNQRASNFQITLAANVAQPLQSGPFICDTIVIDVLSTAANSVFLGYGGGVTTTSGIEVRPGLPLVMQPENTREMWEIQRLLEAILAIQAADRGIPPLGLYKAPRVVFNANEFWVIATAATTVAVMLFMVPELQ